MPKSLEAPMSPKRRRPLPQSGKETCPGAGGAPCCQSCRGADPKAAGVLVFARRWKRRVPKAKEAHAGKRRRPMAESGGGPSVPKAADAPTPKGHKPRCP